MLLAYVLMRAANVVYVPANVRINDLLIVKKDKPVKRMSFRDSNSWIIICS